MLVSQLHPGVLSEFALVPAGLQVFFEIIGESVQRAKHLPVEGKPLGFYFDQLVNDVLLLENVAEDEKQLFFFGQGKVVGDLVGICLPVL